MELADQKSQPFLQATRFCLAVKLTVTIAKEYLGETFVVFSSTFEKWFSEDRKCFFQQIPIN